MFVVLAKSANAQQNNHLPSPSASASPYSCTRAKSERPSPVAMGSLLGEGRETEAEGGNMRPPPRALPAARPDGHEIAVFLLLLSLRFTQ